MRDVSVWRGGGLWSCLEAHGTSAWRGVDLRSYPENRGLSAWMGGDPRGCPGMRGVSAWAGGAPAWVCGTGTVTRYRAAWGVGKPRCLLRMWTPRTRWGPSRWASSRRPRWKVWGPRDPRGRPAARIRWGPSHRCSVCEIRCRHPRSGGGHGAVSPTPLADQWWSGAGTPGEVEELLSAIC